jgi:phytoene/squalene synthetase
MDLLEDLREDFRNNFMEEESTDQFPALLDTMQRFSIPQQYLHDIVAAADMCGRIERFTSFDQWLQLGCRLGGGTLLSLLPIVGIEKPEHEQSAIQCGQAIYLTHLLADITDEIQKLEYFLPAEDVDEFQVNLAKHNPAKPTREMSRLIRLQVSRIEKLFQGGGLVVNHLNLDGQRVMRTVVSVYWNLLMKIKLEPEKFLTGQGNLTRREQLWFKLKHLMGLEGGVSVLPDPSEHEHH